MSTNSLSGSVCRAFDRGAAAGDRRHDVSHSSKNNASSSAVLSAYSKYALDESKYRTSYTPKSSYNVNGNNSDSISVSPVTATAPSSSAMLGGAGTRGYIEGQSTTTHARLREGSNNRSASSAVERANAILQRSYATPSVAAAAEEAAAQQRQQQQQYHHQASQMIDSRGAVLAGGTATGNPLLLNASNTNNIASSYSSSMQLSQEKKYHPNEEPATNAMASAASAKRNLLTSGLASVQPNLDREEKERQKRTLAAMQEKEYRQHQEEEIAEEKRAILRKDAAKILCPKRWVCGVNTPGRNSDLAPSFVPPGREGEQVLIRYRSNQNGESMQANVVVGHDPAKLDKVAKVTSQRRAMLHTIARVEDDLYKMDTPQEDWLSTRMGEWAPGDLKMTLMSNVGIEFSAEAAVHEANQKRVASSRIEKEKNPWAFPIDHFNLVSVPFQLKGRRLHGPVQAPLQSHSGGEKRIANSRSPQPSEVPSTGAAAVDNHSFASRGSRQSGGAGVGARPPPTQGVSSGRVSPPNRDVEPIHETQPAVAGGGVTSTTTAGGRDQSLPPPPPSTVHEVLDNRQSAGPPPVFHAAGEQPRPAGDMSPREQAARAAGVGASPFSRGDPESSGRAGGAPLSSALEEIKNELVKRVCHPIHNPFPRDCSDDDSDSDEDEEAAEQRIANSYSRNDVILNHVDASHIDNKKLFITTINYMKSSGRYERTHIPILSLDISGTTLPTVPRGTSKVSPVLAHILPILERGNMAASAPANIKYLVADRCELTDDDAETFARLIRFAKGCNLCYLSLKFNKFTDVGLRHLKKAVKYRPGLKYLELAGNRGINDEHGDVAVLNQRLSNNREGISNLGFIKSFMNQ